MTHEIMWKNQHPENSNIAKFINYIEKKHQKRFTTYREFHNWSCDSNKEFWQEIIEFFNIEFDTPYKQVLNNYQQIWDAKWCEGGTFNYAQKLLMHDAPQKTAIISITERGERYELSYNELLNLVMRARAGLIKAGVKPGMRVAGILPNMHITIIAFLACASIGAIWSSCSSDFGEQAIIDRLEQISPEVLFVTDGHFYQGKDYSDLPKYQNLATKIKSLKHIILYPLLNPDIAPDNMILWDDFLDNAPLRPEFTPLEFNHPLYILFSSGTTGKPKCIVHGQGGVLLQHIKELALHTDLTAEDNLFFYTTCGWMMWNWMISALALKTCITLYEGAVQYPDFHRLFNIIEKENVTVFGTSARYLSSVEKSGIIPQKKHNLSKLKTILSTGSPLLPQNFDFVYQKIKKDVQLSSISGGTDIVSCFALGNPLLPVYCGELQSYGLGLRVLVFDDNGQSVKNIAGELVCANPCPSMPIGFWNDKDKTLYKKAYFEKFTGVWTHGDYAKIITHKDHDGLIIYGRSDTVLNPSGVRIGTAEIYRQVETIPEISESVVVGQNFDNDIRIVLFVKLNNNQSLTDDLCKKIRNTIRTNTTARHVPQKILQVSDIPKTINGKVVELAVKQLIHNEEIKNLHSIANPQCLIEFQDRKELEI